MPDTQPNDHELSLVSSFLAPGWYVECSCGWRPHPTHAYDRDEAQQLGREHIEDLAPQPERGADH